MEKRAFSFIHDLFKLSDAERIKYAADASEYFGLPRDLNALDFITMNDGTGLQKLVLYARKGTADLLRDIHGIETTDLAQHDGPGYVSFKVTGKNSKGRQEIAVGAHAIEGLKGERLAAAVATAQTRANRRLTMQFVGGGLLDESEVSSQFADINTSTASLAKLAGDGVVMPPMPLPATRPNPSPGLDTTLGKTSVVDPAITTVTATTPIAEIIAKMLAEPKKDTIEPEKSTPVEGYCNAGPEPVKKRTRRKKGAVDLSSSVQNSPKEGVSLQTITESSNDDILECMRTPTSDSAVLGISEAVRTIVRKELDELSAPTETVETPRAMMVTVSAPLPELPIHKFEEYRNRFRKYANEILPKEGGMTNSEGMGITSKVRKFTEKMVGATVLTEEQWEKLFEFLDGYYKQNGAIMLVQYIEKAIQ